MPSLMIYLALSACMTTAVGVYAAPHVDDWWEEWHGDGKTDCRTTVSAAGGMSATSGAVGVRTQRTCTSGCPSDEAPERSASSCGRR